MSGGGLVTGLLRERGRHLSPEQLQQLQQVHSQAYARTAAQVRPLPGARELLARLSEAGVPWAIATSARLESAGPTLKVLDLSPGTVVVTRDEVARAKP